jgi:hypothetical protein
MVWNGGGGMGSDSKAQLYCRDIYKTDRQTDRQTLKYLPVLCSLAAIQAGRQAGRREGKQAGMQEYIYTDIQYRNIDGQTHC